MSSLPSSGVVFAMSGKLALSLARILAKSVMIVDLLSLAAVFIVLMAFTGTNAGSIKAARSHVLSADAKLGHASSRLVWN